MFLLLIFDILYFSFIIQLDMSKKCVITSCIILNVT